MSPPPEEEGEAIPAPEPVLLPRAEERALRIAATRQSGFVRMSRGVLKNKPTLSPQVFHRLAHRGYLQLWRRAYQRYGGVWMQEVVGSITDLGRIRLEAHDGAAECRGADTSRESLLERLEAAYGSTPGWAAWWEPEEEDGYQYQYTLRSVAPRLGLPELRLLAALARRGAPRESIELLMERSELTPLAESGAPPEWVLSYLGGEE